MDEKTILDAASEARRFLATVDALRARRKAEAEKEKQATMGGTDGGVFLYTFQGNRESGAVRRASMDLSRALAALRRP